jgi:biotin operon repressor
MNQEELLYMLKALADESRLDIFQALHGQERGVGEVAAQMKLSEATVSHHLARLREAGLVTLRMAGNHRFYQVNPLGLARLKAAMAEIEALRPSPLERPEEQDEAWIKALGWSQEDEAVLRKYVLNGRILRLPSKRKAMEVILRWLATLFELERIYSEPEVNAILKAAYPPDHVGLRRDLIDLGHLRRDKDGSKYCRGCW